jgi:putative membrane protein
MMKSLFLATAAVTVLAAAPALAQTMNGSPATGTKTVTGNSSSPSSGDKRFIEHVARDGQAEVDLAQLAQQKTQDPEVKALARRLAADHSQSNQQLMQIAQKDAVQAPTGADKTEGKERAKLEKLDGQAFDQAFVKEVVQDHQKDIKYFQQQQGSLQDPQLKSFAQQTLPVLQQHLQMAQQVGGASGSGSSSKPRTSTSGPAR